MSVPTLAQPLSVQLREQTSSAHESAEGSGFMSNLLEGKSSESAYRNLMAQLYFVYEAMEETVRRNADGEFLSQIFDPRLERRGAIESDLEILFGENWRDGIEATAATRDYVQRLSGVGELETIAHHYVRYLGDIAGGQVIAKMMTRLYEIKPEALTFYDFSEIGKIKPYRDAYRDNLDQLDLTAEQTQVVIDEAVRAFELNTAVFRELESEPWSVTTKTPVAGENTSQRGSTVLR